MALLGGCSGAIPAGCGQAGGPGSPQRPTGAPETPLPGTGEAGRSQEPAARCCLRGKSINPRCCSNLSKVVPQKTAGSLSAVAK